MSEAINAADADADAGVVDAIDEWLATLLRALELPETVTVDRALLLDLARDAAHGVARPAAPLTTFLVGLSAGVAGGSAADVERAVTIASRALGQP